MTDDRRRPDNRRATPFVEKKRARSHHDYHVERNDEEATLPPIEPPEAPSLAELTQTVQGLAQGIQRLWPARNDGERLDKMDDKLNSMIIQSSENNALLREFIMPAVKSTMGSVDLLLSHYEAHKIREAHFYDKEWPAAVKKIDDLTERVGLMERRHEKQDDKHEDLKKIVIEVAEKTHAAHEKIGAMEVNALVETRVQQKLTIKQKISYSAIASAIGAIAGLLSKWLR